MGNFISLIGDAAAAWRLAAHAQHLRFLAHVHLSSADDTAWRVGTRRAFSGT